MYSPEEIARRKKVAKRKALRAAEARKRKAAAGKQVKKVAKKSGTARKK